MASVPPVQIRQRLHPGNQATTPTAKHDDAVGSGDRVVKDEAALASGTGQEHPHSLGGGGSGGGFLRPPPPGRTWFPLTGKRMLWYHEGNVTS